MKRLLPLVLCIMLALSACGGTGDQTPQLTTEERETLYKQAIEDARTDADNESNKVSTSADDVNAMTLDMLGFTKEDVDAFAISVSLINIRAYGIAVVMPAEGKAETVKTGLQTFIDNQKMSFQNYLVDQYTIANNARLEELEDGTIVLVMCADQDTVYDSIVATINA